MRFRPLVTTGLGAHGEETLRLFTPAAEARVLDIGCGFGDTTQCIADLVGPAGEILRLAGERAAHLHGEVRQALREGLAEFTDGETIRAPASTWIISATAP